MIEATTKTNVAGTTIDTKCKLVGGLEAEISYDTQDNVLKSLVCLESLLSRINRISITGRPVYIS